MNKRKLTVLVILAVLVVAAAFIYYDTVLINRVKQTAQVPPNALDATAVDDDMIYQTEGSAIDSSLENTTNSQYVSEVMQSESLIENEIIKVGYNTPEYELKLELCENSDKKTFVRMQYYLDGASTINELDEGDLPELAGIFKSRESEKSNVEAFKISQALLNPVHAQLYLLIQGAPLGAYTQASLYMVELNDMSVKKLFSYPGLYGNMAFNKDFSLLAYSFGDPPHLSNLQEDNLIDVFDCTSGEYIIKYNRDSAGNILGKNSSPKYLYDYEFEAWQSVQVMKLRQATRPKKDVDSGLTQTGVLYDIEKNLLLNLDGSELKLVTASTDSTLSDNLDIADASNASGTGSNTAGDGTETGSANQADTGTQGAIVDSEPVKTLKSFYAYLATEEDYAKAMQLLDSSFRLRLNMLQQFGVSEILKSDIDADSASVYSELLKAAKFDTITKEILKDDICTISYYQLLGMSTDSQIRQLMSAQLKKSDKVWKIILIEDGVQ